MSGLERVERDPELLAALEVVGGGSDLGLHHAEGLVGAHDPGDVADRRDGGRQVTPGLAQRNGRGVGELDARGAAAVEHGVVAPGHHRAVDDEQAGAAVGQRCGHDDVVGPRAVRHRVADAGERPRVAGQGCGHTLGRGAPAAAGGGVGRREHDLAGCQPAQQVGPLLGRTGSRDETAGMHDRGQEGLGREHPAELLAGQPDLHRTGPDAAVGLAERQAQHAHLRQPGPLRLVEAGRLRHCRAPVLELGVGLGRPGHGRPRAAPSARRHR